MEIEEDTCEPAAKKVKFMSQLMDNKCGNIGFASECYVYFKKRKWTSIFFVPVLS
jgi:hypothetical protein